FKKDTHIVGGDNG
ncbi:unnamed protein product, partial [Allacma fusca]